MNIDIGFSKLGSIAKWTFLAGVAVFVLMPLAFMFTASFLPEELVSSSPYPWITDHLHWQNYWFALKGYAEDFVYIRNIINSLIVAAAVTGSTVFISALTGYGLAKFPFRGRKLVLMIILSTMMVPFQAIMIPLYLVVSEMGLMDTYAGLILPFLTTPFGVFIMRQYLLTFPDDLLDSARVDGAGEFQIFFKVVVPNSWPAIAALAVLTFRITWDKLLWPLLVVQSSEMKTIPLYITAFSTSKYINKAAMMAAGAIASLPMIILFFSLSQYFVRGARLFTGSKG